MEAATVCQTSTATILTCQKIAKSFKENIFELSRIRNEWDLEYANSLNDWIDDTIEKYHAENLDSIDDVRFREWHEVMVAGLQSLKVFRAALKIDFKDDKPFLSEVFKQLGYSDYFSDAKNGDRLSLYKFLHTFKENMDDKIRQKILQKGEIPESLIEKILIAAQEIEEYKNCFERLGSENKLGSFGQKEVAEIYETIQDICRLAIAYYQFDPIERDEFNFYKVMVNL